MDPSTVRLRRELSALATHPVDQHEQLMEDLRRKHPHKVRLVGRGSPDVACVMYALDLADTVAGKLRVAGFDPVAIVRPELLSFMLYEDMLEEMERADASDGDLVIYFEGSNPQHVGVLDGEGVRSKWGVGHVWHHPELEVPDQYGKARLFRLVPEVSTLRAYDRYVRRRYGNVLVDRAHRALGA